MANYAAIARSGVPRDFSELAVRDVIKRLGADSGGSQPKREAEIVSEPDYHEPCREVLLLYPSQPQFFALHLFVEE